MTTKIDDKPDIVAGAIPESSEELTELLSDEKRAQELFANAELRGEFLQKYVKAVNKARPDIGRMIDDGVQKGLKTFMLEAGISRPDLTASVKEGPTPTGARGAAYNKKAIGAAMDEVFEDTADFMTSIWYQNYAGITRWAQIRNDYSSVEPDKGGFLVPEILRSEILRVALETAIVRPRARVIPMDSPRVPFPAIDSTSHASSIFGGITATWVEEGGTMTETEATFGRVVLQASKLASHCDVPNELLQDSMISFAAFIDDILPQAIAWYEDTAFLTGSGVGQPLGVLESAALIEQAIETGQPADTIAWENIVKMYSRMLPGSLGRAVWVGNNDIFKILPHDFDIL